MCYVLGFCLLGSMLEISLKVSPLKQARQRFEGCSLFGRIKTKQNTQMILKFLFASAYTKQNQGNVILTYCLMLSILSSVFFFSQDWPSLFCSELHSFIPNKLIWYEFWPHHIFWDLIVKLLCQRNYMH